VPEPLAHRAPSAPMSASKAMDAQAKPDRPMADLASVSDARPFQEAASARYRTASSRAAALPDSVTPGATSVSVPVPFQARSASEINEYKFIGEPKFTCSISALQGAGLEGLLEALKAHALAYFGSESGLITRERHRHALQEAQVALARALAEGQNREEIVAEELRLASRALGRLTGKVDVEDILGVIFRDFCIGK